MAKNDYYKAKIKNYSGNIKQIWNTIREIVNRDQNNKLQPSKVNYNNNLIDINTNIKQFTDVFNNHFNL